MRSIHRLCAAMLAVFMLSALLCSCANIGNFGKDNGGSQNMQENAGIDPLDLVSTKTAPAPVIPDYSGKNTLKVAVDSTVGTVSPFFVESDAEITAADLSHVKLLDTERGGRVVTRGIDGQSFEYNGTAYTYFGISNVTVTKNADGTAAYDIALREDVFFSDGTNLTADDVIFCMYVLLDPSYSGYSSLSGLPIKGLDSYRMGMSTLSDIIYQAKDGGAGSSFSSSDAQAYSERLKQASETYISDVLRYVKDNCATSDMLSAHAGKWGTSVSENENLTPAYAMVLFGYAEWEKDADGEYTGALVTADGTNYDCVGRFPDKGELFSAIMSQYRTPGELAASSSDVADFDRSLRDAFADSYEYYFEVMHRSGSSASSVSGIKKTGMYGIRVELERYDASDIYGFCFYVAPLHVYGSRDEYKYTEDRFGFGKGDIRQIKTIGSTVCSGAYIYKGARTGAYRFERNALYYLGCPYVSYVELLPDAAGADAAGDISEGKYDITTAELDGRLISSVKNLNSTGSLEGDIVSLTKLSTGVYGYIGLNASELRIGQDASSEQSRALRRALGILLSYHKNASVYSYYGERAELVDLPLDIGSYVIDESVDMYSTDSLGESIYRDGMSETEKKAAATEAARGYLVLAGYVFDAETKKITGAAEGAPLELEFLLCGGGDYDSPAFDAVKNTADLLSGMGITLSITDVGSPEAMTERLREGKVQLWAFSRALEAETDLYSGYYSKNSPAYAEGTAENLFSVSDRALDALLEQGKSTVDERERAQIYARCFELLGEWGAEVPMYIEYSAFLCTAQRMAKDCELADMTRHYTWADLAHAVQLS